MLHKDGELIKKCIMYWSFYYHHHDVYTTVPTAGHFIHYQLDYQLQLTAKTIIKLPSNSSNYKQYTTIWLPIKHLL